MSLYDTFLTNHILYHLVSYLCFSGYPLRPAMTQQLLQATHSGVYHTSLEGVLSEDTLTTWQQELTSGQIRDIETVCGELMEKLKYRKMKANY